MSDVFISYAREALMLHLLQAFRERRMFLVRLKVELDNPSGADRSFAAWA